MLDKIITAGLTPTVTTDYDRWKPLHWILAVPDVMERGGFDAIIGNPPFLGGAQDHRRNWAPTSAIGSSKPWRTGRVAELIWSPTSSSVPCPC